MPFRSYRSAPVAELGQTRAISRKQAALLLSVPAVSLVLPGLAVEVANAGGTGELTRIAAAVTKFLLFYSGVFALIGLSAAVAAGLLAADRIVLSPDARILAQTAHRTTSLLGIAALGNHIMLEIMASRAGIADSVIPFLAVRSTFFMGLGTISSDIFVVVILTGILRRRFTTGGRPELWRWLHLTAYAAWPLGVLHGLLAGRPAKPYVDWSYGACLAFAALALTARYVIVHRGRTGSTGERPGSGAATMPSAAFGAALALPQGPAHAAAAPIASALPTAPALPAPPALSAAPPVMPRQGPAVLAPERDSLRALPSPDQSWSQPWPRPPRWAGSPWTEADPRDTGYASEANGYYTGEPSGYYDSSGYYDGEPSGYYDNSGYYDGEPSGYYDNGGYEPSGYDEPDGWTGAPDGWTQRPNGWYR